MVRLKSRYVLFEILYPPAELKDEDFRRMEDVMMGYHRRTANYNDINSRAIIGEIRRVLQYNFGDLGSGKLNSLLHLKYFSNSTSTGIIRCHREDLSLLLITLALVNRIGDTDGIIINTVKVSGTIKKLEQFAIKRNNTFINALRRFQMKAKSLNDLDAQANIYQQELNHIELDDDDNE
ncbi:Ribonuclease P/MRP protein subunit POP5 [Nakaseomyces bracarensis]|uniref:Ribonuclease P/MRP protein subunit POP5 n=1 Tax=Nakaseomyces bracarensis TaxID=273131 RepID=A0ABR4NM18_9SACH